MTRIDFVHVGMPKAASTWLQDVLFHTHPELAVLGSRREGPEAHAAFLELVGRLIHGCDLSFDRARFAAELHAQAAALVDRRRAAGRAPAVTGVSHEVLSGEWLIGRNTGFIADTLRAACPDAKVVIVLREQRAAIESSYRELVRMGGVATFRRFLLDPNVSEGFVDGGSPWRSHAVEFFKYSRIVARYRELFGEDRVHVDCMERLVREPDAFAARLCRFLGVAGHAPPAERANVQLSDLALGILRRINYLGVSRLHRRYGPLPVAGLLGATAARTRIADYERTRKNPYLLRERIVRHAFRRLADRWLPLADRVLRPLSPRRAYRFDRLPADFRAFLEREYAADNAALQAMVEPPLAELGYCWPAGRPAAASHIGVASASSRPLA